MGSPGSLGMQSLTLEHLARPFPDRESKVGAGPQASLRGSPRGTSTGSEPAWGAGVMLDSGTREGRGNPPPAPDSVVSASVAGDGGEEQAVGAVAVASVASVAVVDAKEMDDVQKKKTYQEMFKQEDSNVGAIFFFFCFLYHLCIYVYMYYVYIFFFFSF